MPSPSDSLIDGLSQQLGAAHVLTDPAATARLLQQSALVASVENP